MNKPVAGSEYREMGAWGQELKVSAQKDPNMTVDVNAGIFYTEGMKLVEYEGGVSPVIKKPSQYNEWVVVCLNKQGTLYVLEGAPAQKPELPVLEKNYLPLAAIYLTANTTKITSDMIFDVRPRFVAGGYAVDHANVENTKQENCHPIDAITNLRETLDSKATLLDLDKLDEKIDNVHGTNAATFVLNQAQTGVPFANVGIAVKRGEENTVGIRFNEHKGAWEFTNDGSVWNEFITTVSLDGSLREATASSKGVSQLSCEPVDAFKPIAVGDNDPRILAVANKADKVDVYTKDEVDAKISEKIDDKFTYSRQSIDEMLKGKMDVGTIYTEAEIDAKLMGKANVGDSYDKAEVDVALDKKANKADVYSKVDADTEFAKKVDVYNKAEADTLFANKANVADVYDRSQVDLMLADKADVNNVYDRAQVDGALLLKADKTDVYTQGEVDAALALKANTESVYSKTDVDNLLLLKADKSDVYGKADADSTFATKTEVYNKTEADALLADKANAVDVYSKVDANVKFDEKANVLDVYNKTQADALLDTKADKASVFTKVEIADELLPYAKTDDVITRLGDYAKAKVTYTKAEVDNKLTEKANVADVKAALEIKADAAQYDTTAVVNAKLENYVRKSDFNVLNTEAARLADVYTKADIDAKLKDKGNKAELVDLISTKVDDADLLEYVKKDELDTKLNKYATVSVVNAKADAIDVYTKDEADAKYETTKHLASTLALYAKKSEIVTAVDLSDELLKYATKVSVSAKADKTEVAKVQKDVDDLADIVGQKAELSQLNMYMKKSDSVDNVVLESADGSKFRLTVDNDGNLSAVKL